MDFGFEWDSEKEAANQRKHGVTFAEASTVFGDPFARTRADPLHSIDEGSGGSRSANRIVGGFWW